MEDVEWLPAKFPAMLARSSLVDGAGEAADDRMGSRRRSPLFSLPSQGAAAKLEREKKDKMGQEICSAIPPGE